MKFCVIGAGAMGGVYGLSLIEAGYKVNFLDVNRDHVDAVKENGFRLSGIGKKKVHKINISDNENDFKNALMLSYSMHILQERNLQLFLRPAC